MPSHTAAFDARLLELASDILTALGRGELPADAPVVRAAGAALAELRRPLEPPEATPGIAAPGAMGEAAEPARGPRGLRAPRVAPPVEQVLGVATRMREDRLSFAAACAAEAEALGASPQAVRNACTRWLGVSATDWQPLIIPGAEAGVLPLAQRVAERCPWLTERTAASFGVPLARLAPAGSSR